MRWSIAVLSLAVLVSACRPSATVRRTTPVANLESYQSLLVRVAASPEARRYTNVLEFHAADALRRACNFGAVMTPEMAQGEPDLILDLNLQRAFRGGEGLVQNPNLATVDVTLVLTDGIDDELIGSADIRGKSSAVAVNGNDPEQQAIAAVSDSIAKLLARSGCSGARVARAEPDPAPTEDAVDGGTDDDTRAQAEAINDEGKELFRKAEIAAAKERFEAAIALSSDPRYLLNLCLANEALQDYDAATASCKQVIAMEPEPRLAEKAQMRLDIIADIRAD